MLVPNTTAGTAPLYACDDIHLVNEERQGRLGRMLGQRVDAIMVVGRVLGPIVRTDLENVDEHAGVLGYRLALGGLDGYESMNAFDRCSPKG